MKKGYTISILSDYSRLDEVYRLTYEALVLSGEIEPQSNAMFITSPHLDNHSETAIIIAEQDGKIIGSVTATVDSEVGLNMENWFSNELTYYRDKADVFKLGAVWRLTTKPSFRGARKLIIDLITAASDLLIESGCNTCLIILMSRHVSFYHRLMEAKIIESKIVSINKDISMKLSLLEIDLKNTWRKNKFKQLKIV